MKSKSIEIKQIGLEHASTLAKALANEKSDYLKYFTPFEFSLQSITNIFTQMVKDKFFGIFVNEIIVGFYMLRGLDEGYETPSYGVWISSKFSGNGLSKLTLYHAFSFCRINRISKLMLKVHPDNTTAKKLYESLGFEPTGFDKKNGNYIYHKSLFK